MTENANPLMTAPREDSVILYDSKVERELAELRESLDDAFNAEIDGGSSADRWGAKAPSPADEIAAKIDEITERERGRGRKVTLREIPNDQLDEIKDANPPRKGNHFDEVAGYDRKAVERALIRKMMIEPQVTDQQYDEWATSVGSAAWSKVAGLARELQFEEFDLGKAGPSAASALTRARRNASKQPAATE